MTTDDTTTLTVAAATSAAPAADKDVRTADEYLRFLLKSGALIENIAAQLGDIEGRRETNEEALKAQAAITIGAKRERLPESRSVIHEAEQQFKAEQQQIFLTGHALRDFGTKIRTIYQHGNVAQMGEIANLRDLLNTAGNIMKHALENEELNGSTKVNASVKNDYDAIELRMIPVIGDGVEMTNILNQYKDKVVDRLAEAERGRLPEGLGSISVTGLADRSAEDATALKERLIQKNEKHELVDHDGFAKNMTPHHEKSRRLPTLNDEGQPLHGMERFRHIKADAMNQLLKQGEVAEESRRGGGDAYTRRAKEEKDKKAGPLEVG